MAWMRLPRPFRVRLGPQRMLAARPLCPRIADISETWRHFPFVPEPDIPTINNHSKLRRGRPANDEGRSSRRTRFDVIEAEIAELLLDILRLPRVPAVAHDPQR